MLGLDSIHRFCSSPTELLLRHLFSCIGKSKKNTRGKKCQKKQAKKRARKKAKRKHARKKLSERNAPFLKNGLRKSRKEKNTLFIKNKPLIKIKTFIDMIMHEKHILSLEFFYLLQRTGIFASQNENMEFSKKKSSSRT